MINNWILIIGIFYYIFGVYFMTCIMPQPMKTLEDSVTGFDLFCNMILWWIIGPILALVFGLDKIVIKQKINRRKQ